MSQTEQALAAVAVLLLLAVGASKMTRRFGVPVLLVFMGIGMLAGSEGIGGVEFSDFKLAQAVGVTSLAFILFSGGLDTDMSSVRRVAVPAISMATVGVAITCAVVGGAAYLVLDVPFETALLVGAVVSSTDAAAVFLVLRSQSVDLRGDLRPALELESGSNDPMAVFLTIGLLTVITEPDTTPVDLVLLFVQQMLLGAVLGYVLARIAVLVINKVRLVEDGLYPVMTIAFAALIFGGTATLGGSGFLAVYIAGIVIGNARIVHRHTIMKFHDALAWLAQILMFLVFGLLAFPSQIASVAVEGMLIAAVLVFVARPIATFISLPTRRFALKGKLLISWVGLRGAVPIILATFALAENIEHAELVFDVVFFTVFVSVLVQGTTVTSAARFLGLAVPANVGFASPLAFNPVDELSEMNTFEFVVEPAAADQQLLDLDLPKGVLVLLVTRDTIHLVPEGNTVLAENDRVLVLAPESARGGLREIFEARPGRSD